VVAALATVALASARPEDADRERVRSAPLHSVAARALRDGETIDVNAADTHDLVLLPGVGPKLAERIVAERTSRGGFARVEDLRQVRGIGPATFARLLPLVRAEPQRSKSSAADALKVK
jgi:competence ComEA-like helix-hairpin-helix protein